MITEIYPVTAGIIIMLAAIIIMKKRKFTLYQVILIELFILYLTGVICATFFPMDYSHKVREGYEILGSSLLLTPFSMITHQIQSYNFFVVMVQVGGNIFMTVPLGILLPMLMPDRKKWFYPLIFFCFTFAIESMQLLTGALLGTFYRTADIDDIILNFTGAMIGLLIYKICTKLKERTDKKTNIDDPNT